jgi:signal transduction histidine kinase
MARAAADLVLRRFPGAILGAVLVIAVAVPWTTPLLLPACVLVYALGRYRGPRAAAAGVIATTAAAVAHRALWEGSVSSGEAASTAIVCAATGLLGWSLAQRHAAQVRERELQGEGAVTEERLRIARELHDAVGHDVSLMIVQAQALAATIPAAGEQATAIAELGRHTMGELHRTLRVLREDADREPQPGLASLAEVVEGARAAGMHVDFAVEGAPRDLEPALDRSAFRIAQEAITNSMRHAGGVGTALTVRYGDDALEVLVDDDGPGPEPGWTPGHGLAGMRERATLFGGTLDAGPRERGGYRVRATLPYREPA